MKTSDNLFVSISNRNRRIDDLSHFVVVHDVLESTSQITVFPFASLADAESSFRELEGKYRSEDRDGHTVRVLLFSAESSKALEITHPHYFVSSDYVDSAVFTHSPPSSPAGRRAGRRRQARRRAMSAESEITEDDVTFHMPFATLVS